MPGADILLDRLASLANLPSSESTALPPEFYHTDKLFELERSRLFARDWACPGMAAEVPKAGDYLCFSIGEQPMCTIRSQDGQVRSFSNVCLHRMMRLLEGRGSCSRIVCPYHAWTYGIDGQLVGAPHMKRTPGFEPGLHHLPEIRTEVWKGWISVPLDPQADSVTTLLEPLQGVVAPYDMAGYVPVVT